MIGRPALGSFLEVPLTFNFKGKMTLKRGAVDRQFRCFWEVGVPRLDGHGPEALNRLPTQHVHGALSPKLFGKGCCHPGADGGKAAPQVHNLRLSNQTYDTEWWQKAWVTRVRRDPKVGDPVPFHVLSAKKHFLCGRSPPKNANTEKARRKCWTIEKVVPASLPELSCQRLASSGRQLLPNPSTQSQPTC